MKSRKPPTIAGSCQQCHSDVQLANRIYFCQCGSTNDESYDCPPTWVFKVSTDAKRHASSLVKAAPVPLPSFAAPVADMNRMLGDRSGSGQPHMCARTRFRNTKVPTAHAHTLTIRERANAQIANQVPPTRDARSHESRRIFFDEFRPSRILPP